MFTKEPRIRELTIFFYVASAFLPSSVPASTHTFSGTSIGSTGLTCPLWRSVLSTPTRTSGYVPLFVIFDKRVVLTIPKLDQELHVG